MATMAYRVVGRVHLAVHGDDLPTPEEWTAYLKSIADSAAEVDGVLSLTAGGGPSAAQRQQSTTFWAAQPRRLPISVVTPSALVRNMANILSWVMGDQIRAFKPGELPAALQHLRVPLAQAPALEQAANELRSQLT